MQALHQWFSEPCPDRHRLQTSWHILRVFPSPAGPETLGRAQQNCFNILQIQFDGHCSTLPQISCTSSATLTISYCPGLLLLPEKKKKKKSKKTCRDLQHHNQPSTIICNYITCPDTAVPTAFLKESRHLCT